MKAAKEKETIKPVHFVLYDKSFVPFESQLIKKLSVCHTYIKSLHPYALHFLVSG